MTDRIQFTEHRGKAIMLIDFSELSSEEIIRLVNEVQKRLAHAPANSALTLADFTNSHVDKAAATRMKEVLTLDRPHVKKSAWVGVDSLPKVFYENFKNFSRRDFPTFQTRAEAMDWLAAD